MAERIVVSLHLRAVDVALGSYFRRALAAKKRAEALGAMLTSWGSDSFAFDFGAEEVEEAIDLALATFDDKSREEPRFGAGVAFGELTRIGAGSSLAMLGWGEPLVVAARLARSAEPGEVLIDDRCPPHLQEALRTRGERQVEPHAMTALVLDTAQPFRRDTLVDALGGDDAKVRVTVPPLPPITGLSRDLLDRAPHGAPVVRARRGSDPPPTIRTRPEGGAEIDAPASTTTPGASPSSSPVSSPSPSSEPGSGPRQAVVPPAPVSPRSPAPGAAMPPARLPAAGTAPTAPPPGAGPPGKPSSVPPLSASRISWPGSSEEYTELTSAARQALLKGNVSELERLSDELRSHGDHADLADRMAGFVAWNRGAKAEGLRKLRAAADAETRPAHRVRALLAYGVALAASGRTDGALLAALGAIARAREVADRQGEHVCARFIARLSAAAGYERAARTWAAIADEVAAPRPTSGG